MTNFEQFEFITNNIQNGALPQTVLFQGPYGAGQVALVHRVVTSILSQGFSHPDVHSVSLPEGKSSIPLATVHQAQEFLSQSPLSGDTKICVFFDADFLAKEGQNALLKTIEEPTKSSYIFFVSAYNRLLPTILSRCQSILVKPEEPKDERLGFIDIPRDTVIDDMVYYLDILHAPLYQRSAYLESIFCSKNQGVVKYHFWIWETLHYLVLLAHSDTERYTEYSAFLSPEIQKRLQNQHNTQSYLYRLTDIKDSILFTNRKATLALESLLLSDS